MTDAQERYEEFMDRCLNADNSRPGATRIDDPVERTREATRCRHLSEYHVKAVQDSLTGQAPLMAIREGYYVRLHKANEAIALAGFKPRSHECILLGIRGLFDAPELADLLRRAYQERRNVDYYIDPEDPELVEFAGPEAFVHGTMNEFVDRTEELIVADGLR